MSVHIIYMRDYRNANAFITCESKCHFLPSSDSYIFGSIYLLSVYLFVIGITENVGRDCFLRMRYQR